MGESDIAEITSAIKKISGDLLLVMLNQANRVDVERLSTKEEAIHQGLIDILVNEALNRNLIGGPNEPTR